MSRKEQILLSLLFIVGVIVLCNQTRYLFCYPVPDTGMWFGDESWTMLTLRALTSTGIAKVPEALGSSLAHSNGFINGSVWISGLLYGIPANLLRSTMSPVAVGRLVGLLVSLLLLWVCSSLSRYLGVRWLSIAISLLLFIFSDLFFTSSHSARLDSITGCAVIGYFLLLVWLFRRSESKRVELRWYFAMSFIAGLSLTIYVHVPTLIFLPCLWAGWKLKAFRNWRSAISFIAGGVLSILLLIGFYWVTAGKISLLGDGYNQYYNVANSLPILHPFSWQVQRINTIDRLLQVWSIAPLMIVALFVGIGISLITKTRFTKVQIFFFELTALLLISWVLSEGPAIYYNIHVAGVVAVVIAVLIDRSISPANFFELLIGMALIVAAVFVGMRQSAEGNFGERLTRENDQALSALLHPIESSNPLVLTDQPGMNWVAGDASLRLMTNHFLLFGAEDKPIAKILKEHNVSYLLLYATDRWQSPFRQTADSLYELIGERTGHLTDEARTYSDPDWDKLDTLRLYKAK